MYNCNFSKLRFSVFSIRSSGNTDKVDAIAVSRCIRKIVSQVSSSFGNAFPVCEAANTTLPDDFGVTETWPAMGSGFLDELFHGSSNRCGEQVRTSNRVIEFDWAFLILDGFQKSGRLPISGVFGVVTVKIADAIGSFVIAIPAKVLLDWLLASSVSLLRHCFFSDHDGVFRTRGRSKETIENVSLGSVGRRRCAQFGGAWSKGNSRAKQRVSEDQHAQIQKLHISFILFFQIIITDERQYFVGRFVAIVNSSLHSKEILLYRVIKTWK